MTKSAPRGTPSASSRATIARRAGSRRRLNGIVLSLYVTFRAFLPHRCHSKRCATHSTRTWGGCTSSSNGCSSWNRPSAHRLISSNADRVARLVADAGRVQPDREDDPPVGDEDMAVGGPHALFRNQLRSKISSSLRLPLPCTLARRVSKPAPVVPVPASATAQSMRGRSRSSLGSSTPAMRGRLRASAWCASSSAPERRSRQPGLEASRSSCSLMRLGPKSPGWRSLKHNRKQRESGRVTAPRLSTYFGPIIVVEDVIHARVDQGVEHLAQRPEVEGVVDQESRHEAPFTALRLGHRDRGRSQSTPVASSPSAAAISVCSPVPQPESRTRPRSRPASATACSAGWGRPMSHGGVPSA